MPNVLWFHCTLTILTLSGSSNISSIMFSFLLFIWNTLTPSFFKKACQLKSKKYIYVHSKTLVLVHIWKTNIFITRSWKANGFEKIHTLCLRVEKTFFFLSILWGKEINFFYIHVHVLCIFEFTEFTNCTFSGIFVRVGYLPCGVCVWGWENQENRHPVGLVAWGPSPFCLGPL